METFCEIKVRYAETDAMGVVYHANYLVYCEIARADFLDKLGFPYTEMEKQSYVSPVLSANMEYRLPFRYGDTVVVRTRVIKLTSVRVYYRCDMYLKGEDISKVKPRVSAITSHCVVERDTFKPVVQKRLFPELQAAYQAALENDQS